jgi:hypothetical protein
MNDFPPSVAHKTAGRRGAVRDGIASRARNFMRDCISIDAESVPSGVMTRQHAPLFRAA